MYNLVLNSPDLKKKIGIFQSRTDTWSRKELGREWRWLHETTHSSE